MTTIEPSSGHDRNCDNLTICDIIKLAEQLSGTTTDHPARQVIWIQARTGEDRSEALILEATIIERLIAAAPLLSPVMRCIEDEAARLSTAPAMFRIKAIPLIDLTDSSTLSTFAHCPCPPTLENVVHAHPEHIYYEHIDTIPNTPVSAPVSTAVGDLQDDAVYSREQYIQPQGMLEPSVARKRKRADTEYSRRYTPVEERTLCRICWKRDLDTCFSSCGHICCAACAAVISQCPICRKTISERVKVHAVLSDQLRSRT
jgi:hypothetical protein